MEYEHDIFLSYKRDRVQEEWIRDHFLPLLESDVSNEIAGRCGRPAMSIFFDKAGATAGTEETIVRGLEPGAKWEPALQEAIRKSRCMIGLWSPNYFFSGWCLMEWKSFAEREQRTSATLVLPVSVYDGNNFPEDARAVQAFDISEFVNIGDGFKKSEAYVRFQAQVRLLASRAGGLVQAAPAFAEFPIVTSPPPSGGIRFSQPRM